MKINCSRDDKVIQLQSFKENEYFGEYEFFTGEDRNRTARSVNFSSLFTLKRDEVIPILKENPEDFEKFCMIKDQLIFYRSKRILRSKCPCCRALDHSIFECNCLHFVPNIEHVIKKYLFSVDQKREHFHRRSQKLLNSKKNYKRILRKAFELQTFNLKTTIMENTDAMVDEVYDDISMMEQKFFEKNCVTPESGTCKNEESESEANINEVDFTNLAQNIINAGKTEMESENGISNFFIK